MSYLDTKQMVPTINNGNQQGFLKFGVVNIPLDEMTSKISRRLSYDLHGDVVPEKYN